MYVHLVSRENHLVAASVLPIIIGVFAMAGGILLIIVVLRIRQTVK